jgi:pyruvate dehydrogenase (quinone)/pyruvate oxidase
MADTAADVFFDTLHSWGIDVIFGIPGSGTLGLQDALRRRRDRIRFIRTCHEESAAFMACAYAKFTGRLGACMASGAGSVRLLNGLYDAKMDSQPVVAITGDNQRSIVGAYGRHAIDLPRVFQDVSVYNERVLDPTQAGRIGGIACRTALCSASIAHVNFPAEFQRGEAASGRFFGPGHAVDSFREQEIGMPAETELEQAAEILNAGKRVVILVGRGALAATDLVEELADRLAAPVVKALLGKSALPDDSPYSVGGLGLVGTRPAQEAVESCDTIFLIGTSFPYIEFLPKPGQARGVQIDLDPSRIGLRYPVEVGLLGDSVRILRELIPLLSRKSDRSFLTKAQKGMTEWWRLMLERGTTRETPMKPQVVAWELGNRLDDNAIISADSGTAATWFARQIRSKRGQKSSVSGLLASMANGLPYAIAAQVAFPDRQCVALVGDGAFSMLMGEFLTAVRYRLPIKIVVLKNNVLGQIKWEQIVFLGNPEFGVSLQPIDFAAYARACGGAGFTIEDPEACGKILDQSLATSGPVVVEAVVDPYTPPMPAKVTPKQAVHFAESLLRGEPHPIRIALTATGEKLREMI